MITDQNKYLIVLLGPTGIGKTELCLKLAEYLKTDIISADSRQIFKELKIGTAAPLPEQLKRVRHYMIGNKSIFDYYNASMFEYEVLDILNNIYKSKDLALMTGGSMMYIDAVCKGIDDLPTIDPELRKELYHKYQNEGIESIRRQLKLLDPDYYEKVDLKNAKRILKGLEVSIQTGKPYSSFLTNKTKKRNFNIIKIGLNRDRTELHEIINLRVDKMVDAGLIEEARKFYEHKDNNSLNTVGYKELFDFFDGKINKTTAIELIKRNTRRYARKQLSWFRRDISTRWFHPTEFDEIKNYIKQKVNIK